MSGDGDRGGDYIGEALAGGDADLGLDEVDAGDHLGDAVLDLDAGVHLDEVELAVLVHEELDGPGVPVADVLHASLDGLAHLGAQFGRDHETGGLFDELLVAALDGALALTQAEDVAVLVGENLELDVAGALDEFFEVEVTVAEGARGLAGGLLEERGQLFGGAHDAHSASTAAGRCLEHDGVADGAGALQGLGLAGEHAVGAGKDGDAGLLHGLARGAFFAHQAGDLGRRADELDVGGAADLGEVGVLAEQAVSGMDGVDVGDLGGGDDGGDVEVALGGAGRADADGLVGELDMQAVPVGLAVDGDGADAHLAAGGDHPQRDLTPICN